MGLSHSTLRLAAPASFLIDFAAQQYGMLSKPSMLDVHNAHLSFWSPQPYFIAGFFFPQQLLQLAWLWRLWQLPDPAAAGTTLSPEERREGDLIRHYVPFYCVGNLCIAAWMFFWNAADLRTSNIFVTINSLTQLYYIFALQPRLNTSSTSSLLTHIISKTFAGIGVLDLLHNGSVAYFDHQGPSSAVKLLTGLGFAGLASVSDWIFGGCLVYDLVALAVGQRAIGQTHWGNMLGVYALGAAGIVTARNLARPPYTNDAKEDYKAVEPGSPTV